MRPLYASLRNMSQLPAARIADAGGGVPRQRKNLVVGFLNPDGMMIVEVDDCAQGLAIIEPILHERISGQAGDAALDPGIATDAFGAGDSEVLHDSKRFGVRTEV